VLELVRLDRFLEGKDLEGLVVLVARAGQVEDLVGNHLRDREDCRNRGDHQLDEQDTMLQDLRGYLLNYHLDDLLDYYLDYHLDGGKRPGCHRPNPGPPKELTRGATSLLLRTFERTICETTKGMRTTNV